MPRGFRCIRILVTTTLCQEACNVHGTHATHTSPLYSIEVPADNYWYRLLQVPIHLQVVAKSLRHWLAEMKLDPQ